MRWKTRRGYTRLLSPLAAGHVRADDRASMQSCGKASNRTTDKRLRELLARGREVFAAARKDEGGRRTCGSVGGEM